MNDQTTTARPLDANTAQAIEIAQAAQRDSNKAHERLLDAAGALHMAYDAHAQCECTFDAYTSTYHAYEAAKDKLAGLAIDYSRALEHAADTRHALTAIWSLHTA